MPGAATRANAGCPAGIWTSQRPMLADACMRKGRST
jgi:hypothetical protein